MAPSARILPRVRLGVVIPVYNEHRLLPELVHRLEDTPPPVDPRSGVRVERLIVLVDDGSTDGTRDLVGVLAARAGGLALAHERNAGKGAAVRTGLRAALEAGCGVALIQDGDLEYDPRDHAALVAPILAGSADVVFGSRYARPGAGLDRPLHTLANRLLTALSNAATGLRLTDMECCLKAFARPVLERLTIEEDRFGIEPEIAAKVARLRLPGAAGRERRARVAEVPVRYAGRGYSEGKKITWRDGVSAVRCIARYARPR